MDNFEPMYSGEKRTTAPTGPTEVTVVNFNMPFWSMVGLMVKWAIAAIPAFIILVIFYMMMIGFGAGFLAALLK